MHPVLFHLGDLPIHTYGVLYLLAFLAGIFTAAGVATRSGVPFGRTVDLLFMVAIAGEIGARLAFLMGHWESLLHGQASFRQFLVSGRTVLGGLVVGVLAAAWLFHRYKLPVGATLDGAGTGTPLAMGIGRLGCLAGGCCYGKPTDAWWGITFTDAIARRFNGTPLGIPLHPTQALQALDGVLIFLFLLWLHPRRRFDGQSAATFLLLAGLERFGVEFLRDDTSGAFLGLTNPQWAGLGLFVAGGVWILWRLSTTRGVRTVGRASGKSVDVAL